MFNGKYSIGEKKEANLSLRIESTLNDDLEKYCMSNNITKTELIKTLLKNFLYKKD
jgi:hypothetical protein